PFDDDRTHPVADLALDSVLADFLGQTIARAAVAVGEDRRVARRAHDRASRTPADRHEREQVAQRELDCPRRGQAPGLPDLVLSRAELLGLALNDLAGDRERVALFVIAHRRLADA